MRNKNILIILIYGCGFWFIGCKKLIEIAPPVSTITTAQAFSTDDQANSAMAGIYINMVNTAGLNFCSGALSIYSGLSSDELNAFNQTSSQEMLEFQANDITSSSSLNYSNFWSSAYSYIYGANAIISGVQSSTAIHDSVKGELTGEACFIRAFCNFYLTNLFGDIPLVTSTNWNNTRLLSRTSSALVYESIIQDLSIAISLLPSDYSVSGGQRVRPNKWAALALLARAYLYNKDWVDAEGAASLVIGNSSMYGLSDSVGGVFLANSNEAIWQLEPNSSGASFNATPEGSFIIPYNPTSNPYVYLTSELISSFEDGDNRKTVWVDSTVYAGITYYYPYKYIIGTPQEMPNNAAPQYYMMLRVAEQYLIRAEARAQQGNLAGAILDLDTIRVRAGLTDLSPSLIQSQVLAAVVQERKVELFAEWGHRWLDLKRWGSAPNVLSSDKGSSVNSNDLLYPIPLSELTADPNLTQNSGY